MVAFFYATFPRPTETFVRRELRALGEIGLKPDIYSIWKGLDEWEGRPINRFRLFKLWTLFFWIPYWAWKKPVVFRDILKILWESPCPNLQNWNETFLGLGFALVEAYGLKCKKYSLFHGVWATMPATAVFALHKLIDVPFSMGAMLMMYSEQEGIGCLQLSSNMLLLSVLLHYPLPNELRI